MRGGPMGVGRRSSCAFYQGLTTPTADITVFINLVRLTGLIMGVIMERTIGATELRRRLTDVLNAVREERATYVIETFERSQAALIHLEEYRQFQRFRQEREAFFDWLTSTAEQNAQRNRGLDQAEVLAIIAAARQEAAAEG